MATHMWEGFGPPINKLTWDGPRVTLLLSPQESLLSLTLRPESGGTLAR